MFAAKMHLRVLRAFLLWLGLLAQCAFGAERLPAMDAELAATSVSGVSSGGYMAVQFHVAHSSTVIGAGVLAAGPYYCAQGSSTIAYYNCMEPGASAPLPLLPLLKAETEAQARLGRIDATASLARARVWLFSGTHDHTVSPEVVEALGRYYREYVAAGAVAFVRNTPAGHGMVTVDFGSSCAVTGTPFINDCDLDAAGALLNHILGPLKPPVAHEVGRIIAFDQAEFAAGAARALSLSDTGYLYLPDACRQQRCRVHVAFHGCRQSAEDIGLAFVRHAGYNRWADSNRLIVLYPQTTSRLGLAGWPPNFIFNPYGCWDWWGYTGPLYHTRDGAQIRAVMGMLARLAQPR